MDCYLCKHAEPEIVHKGTRDNPDVNVLRCPSCSLVYLSSTAHVDVGLYEADGQTESTGNIEINAYNFDTEKRFRDYANVLADKTVLEFGCGRGAFARKLVDLNITDQVYTLEPNRAYRAYLREHFKHVDDVADVEDGVLDYVTLFHVMEHLVDPVTVLASLYDKLKPGGRIIIEVPHAEDALLRLYESEAFADFTYWSLHLYLFNRRTLEVLAARTPYRVVCIRYYQRYGLANHLHWLARGQAGGQNKWPFLNNEGLDDLYGKTLAELGMTDTIVMVLEK